MALQNFQGDSGSPPLSLDLLSPTWDPYNKSSFCPCICHSNLSFTRAHHHLLIIMNLESVGRNELDQKLAFQLANHPDFSKFFPALPAAPVSPPGLQGVQESAFDLDGPDPMSPDRLFMDSPEFDPLVHVCFIFVNSIESLM